MAWPSTKRFEVDKHVRPNFLLVGDHVGIMGFCLLHISVMIKFQGNVFFDGICWEVKRIYLACKHLRQVILFSYHEMSHKYYFT